MNKKWRRRNYFIKKDLQGRYMFTFFMVISAAVLIFIIVFVLLVSDTMTILYEQSNVYVDRTPLALLRQLIEAHWLVLVSIGLAVAVFSMFLTHRIAGPLYRFEKTVEELTAGHLDFQIKLRKKDDARELADRFNLLITTYAEKINELKRLTGRLEGVLREAAKTSPQDKFIKEATEVNNQIKTVLDFFKTHRQ